LEAFRLAALGESNQTIANRTAKWAKASGLFARAGREATTEAIVAGVEAGHAISDGIARQSEMQAWLDNVARVPTTRSASALAILLSGHFLARKEGQPWPSQRDLSAELQITQRGLAKQVKILRDAGFLKFTKARGRGHRTSYELIHRGQNICSGF
jgi:hypothetical protein